GLASCVYPFPTRRSSDLEQPRFLQSAERTWTEERQDKSRRPLCCGRDEKAWLQPGRRAIRTYYHDELQYDRRRLIIRCSSGSNRQAVRKDFGRACFAGGNIPSKARQRQGD